MDDGDVNGYYPLHPLCEFLRQARRSQDMPIADLNHFWEYLYKNGWLPWFADCTDLFCRRDGSDASLDQHRRYATDVIAWVKMRLWIDMPEAVERWHMLGDTGQP